MEQIKSKINIWPVFATATMIIIIAAAICWSLHHPYGTSWDEAEYLNEAQIDAQRLQHGMLLRLGRKNSDKKLGASSAYRLFALPVLGLFGFHTVTVRLVSLACFVLSSLFVYLAARRVGKLGRRGICGARLLPVAASNRGQYVGSARKDLCT